MCDARKSLSIECIGRNLMDERNNGNLKVLCQVDIHKITFRSGIQQGLAVVDSGCPLQSYREESCGRGFLQGQSTRQ